MTIARMHDYADRLAASNVGYDQGQRWSFNPGRDGLSVQPNSECDCSSSGAAIARAGGYPVDTADPIYTANYRQKLTAAGFQAISVAGKSRGELVEILRPGDHLLGPGHTAYYRSTTQLWSAESDERGRASGGQAGDQTGLEARYRTLYMRSRGWEWILRPPADPLVAVTPLPVVDPTTVTPLKVRPRAIEWSRPPAALVRIVQRIVGVTVDGSRGPRTIAATKAWQRKRGLRADGQFGPASAEAYLLSVGNLYRGRRGMPEAAVRLVQWITWSRVDGQWGDLTHAGVQSAQAWAGLTPDGNAGPATKRAITI